MQTRSSRVNPRFLEEPKSVEELERAAEQRLAKNLAGNCGHFCTININ